MIKIWEWFKRLFKREGNVSYDATTVSAPEPEYTTGSTAPMKLLPHQYRARRREARAKKARAYQLKKGIYRKGRKDR